VINRYFTHESPTKSRIFALRGERDDELEVVTTLGADDVSKTAALLAALNDLETNATTEALEGVLAVLPQAVNTAVRRHVAVGEDRAPEPRTTPNTTASIRLMYFSALDDELEEHIEGAYNLGLGIRLTNEVDRGGQVGWSLELFAEEEFVPAGKSVRTWPLPSGAPLLKTWTSERSGIRGPWLPVVAEAVGLASDASRQGRWVRVHTVLHGDGPDEFDGTSTSEFVVDIFDAAIPLDPEADDEPATDYDDISPSDAASPATGSRHQRDHRMIAQAITEDWLADTKLLVHLAREHTMRVEDVSNAGLATLIDLHDRAHGGSCFAEAKNRSPDDGLR